MRGMPAPSASAPRVRRRAHATSACCATADSSRLCPCPAWRSRALAACASHGDGGASTPTPARSPSAASTRRRERSAGWRMARRSAALSQRRRPVSCTAPLVTIISDGLDIEAPKSLFLVGVYCQSLTLRHMYMCLSLARLSEPPRREKHPDLDHKIS